MQAVDIADRTVTFGQNGSSVKVDYDLLIGADGVNSRVRCCHKCSQNLQADVASERHMRSIAEWCHLEAARPSPLNCQQVLKDSPQACQNGTVTFRGSRTGLE